MGRSMNSTPPSAMARSSGLGPGLPTPSSRAVQDDLFAVGAALADPDAVGQAFTTP